jgi:hypothetical protein
MKQRTLFDSFLTKPMVKVDANSQPCEPSPLVNSPLAAPDTFSNQKENTTPQETDIDMSVDEPLIDLVENCAFPFLFNYQFYYLLNIRCGFRETSNGVGNPPHRVRTSRVPTQSLCFAFGSKPRDSPQPPKGHYKEGTFDTTTRRFQLRWEVTRSTYCHTFLSNKRAFCDVPWTQ